MYQNCNQLITSGWNSLLLYVKKVFLPESCLSLPYSTQLTGFNWINGRCPNLGHLSLASPWMRVEWSSWDWANASLLFPDVLHVPMLQWFILAGPSLMSFGHGLLAWCSDTVVTLLFKSSWFAWVVSPSRTHILFIFVCLFASQSTAVLMLAFPMGPALVSRGLLATSSWHITPHVYFKC